MTTKTDAIRLLSTLTNAHGVSGSEAAVRAIFRQELTGCGTPGTDVLGNVWAERAGPADGPRVLVTGHMDEVGFAVQHITARGFIKLVALGGWWTHTLVAQRVRILTRSGEEIMGVIGSTPPHFLNDGAKDKLLTLDQMYVDVGAGSREEAESWGIALGDPVAPDSAFTPMRHEDMFCAKAFDNRVGIGATIHTLQELRDATLPCTLTGAATVQEEVGCRGAVTLGEHLRPDVAIVLEGTPADDTHGMDPAEGQGRIGAGVQIRLMDPTAIMNRPLVDFLQATARELGIPCQIAVRKSGGTDARSLQLSRAGVPCVVLGTPARYIHSHNSIINIHDYLACVRLTVAAVQRCTAAQVEAFRTW